MLFIGVSTTFYEILPTKGLQALQRSKPHLFSLLPLVARTTSLSTNFTVQRPNRKPPCGVEPTYICIQRCKVDSSSERAYGKPTKLRAPAIPPQPATFRQPCSTWVACTCSSPSSGGTPFQTGPSDCILVVWNTAERNDT